MTMYDDSDPTRGMLGHGGMGMGASMRHTGQPSTPVFRVVGPIPACGYAPEFNTALSHSPSPKSTLSRLHDFARRNYKTRSRSRLVSALLIVTEQARACASAWACARAQPQAPESQRTRMRYFLGKPWGQRKYVRRDGNAEHGSGKKSPAWRRRKVTAAGESRAGDETVSAVTGESVRNSGVTVPTTEPLPLDLTFLISPQGQNPWLIPSRALDGNARRELRCSPLPHGSSEPAVAELTCGFGVGPLKFGHDNFPVILPRVR
ncbi:hypothetical protein AXG93_2318s1120 [Marchantia polymorpha subsp. ruderalis]|uniref:Uncharacterized protein n=1 Tax=Marchantia polymorpha subsp. ruderalis TaxID=1480154 RepID=A0A176VQW8_MARPO|nr:hypothetical protein AXG93_2318s1120 [Marchantia polymorpha subsp. ruderalis]